jgi:hypothetical protein
MAKLTAKTRNAIPTSKFAGPNRTYPDQDPSHARNALSRVANKSPALKARVDAKVHRDWPGIGEDSKKTTAQRSESGGKRTRTVHKSNGKFTTHSAIGSHPGYTMGMKKKK